MKKKWFLSGFGIFMLIGILASGLLIASCSTTTETPAQQAQPVPVPLQQAVRAEDGIHIGIIRFAETSEDVTGNVPVLLDREGRINLTSVIDTRIRTTENPGTSLFHAVHLAMANLTENAPLFPQNLDSVYVITFTDGLDNQSVGLSRLASDRIEGKAFDNDAAYARYIEEEIANRRIAGVPITAYSVGIKGSDVADDGSFNSHLRSIASPGNHQVLDSFNELQNTFNDIAVKLNLHSTRTNFVLRTPLLVNSRIRITFDARLTDASSSARYIEGTVSNPSENSYLLTDIVYSEGISSIQGAGPITGTRNGYHIDFVFDNITGYDPSVDRVNTSLWRQEGSHWQHDVEYSSEDSSRTTTERHSTAIYLVLDCSRSLNAAQNEAIRRAASEFINNIYSRYYGL